MGVVWRVKMHSCGSIGTQHCSTLVNCNVVGGVQFGDPCGLAMTREGSIPWVMRPTPRRVTVTLRMRNQTSALRGGCSLTAKSFTEARAGTSQNFSKYVDVLFSACSSMTLRLLPLLNGTSAQNYVDSRDYVTDNCLVNFVNTPT
jgi:hypothetical protein